MKMLLTMTQLDMKNLRTFSDFGLRSSIQCFYIRLDAIFPMLMLIISN